MKKIFSALLPVAFLLLGTMARAQQQERCGFTNLVHGLTPRQHAQWEADYNAQVQQVLAREASVGAQSKTTGTAPVPVVFHFLLTTAQRSQLGNNAGIIERVTKQLESLNDDFNALNADQSKIPAPFKPLFGNVGIRFGLAGATTSNTIAKGIEVRIISNGTFYDMRSGFADAKRTAEGGLNGWNPDKYLNVWVFETDGGILGLAIPVRFVNFSFPGSGRTFANADVGVVLHYGVVGRRQRATDLYLGNNDLGRTMTHEVGHFFNLRHIWGDDPGCTPDDGIPDTPLQDIQTYCSANGCPTFPKTDKCSPTGNGIMFMNYMDYTDDRAMMMFTNNQASLMRAEVVSGGMLEKLTLNPSLAVADIAAGPAALRLFPNPAHTRLFVENPTGGKITNLTLCDVTGREVYHAASLAGTQNTIEVGGFAPGLYFVRATVGTQPFAGKVAIQ